MRRKYVEQREKGGSEFLSLMCMFHYAKYNQQVYLQICKFIALETA